MSASIKVSQKKSSGRKKEVRVKKECFHTLSFGFLYSLKETSLLKIHLVQQVVEIKIKA